MSKLVHARTICSRQPRGAALMAALLLSLVLSGVGIVVMQNTMLSMRMSGNYKMRKQASAAAEAAVLVTSNMVGNQASSFWRGMSTDQQNMLTGNSTQGGMGTGAPGLDARVTSLERGGAMILTSNPNLQAQNPNIAVPVFTMMQQAAAGETGLFQNQTGAIRSHEQLTAGANNSFNVILRDPVEGPPASGFSQGFCFKKVYFASQALYGAQPEDANSWQIAPLATASGRNAVEGFIGPIECGAR
jgi:hypothetical protein